MGEPDQFSISCRVRTAGQVGEDRWVVDAVVHGIVVSEVIVVIVSMDLVVVVDVAASICESL